MKYLYLDDLTGIFNKSWSFCQKEVAVGRLKAEKKYHLGKQRYLITEEDLSDYIKNNQDRVGSIDDNRISELSFNLNEVRVVEKEKKEYEPVKVRYEESERIRETPQIKEKEGEDITKYFQVLQNITNTLEELKKNSGNDGNKLYVDELNKNLDILRTEKDELKKEYEQKIEKIEKEKVVLSEELKIETHKVEKIYFLSDRFDKAITHHREVMIEMIRISQGLSSGEKIKLGEFKKLISSLGTLNEKVEITEDGDIRLLESGENRDIINKIIEIDDSVELEKSREGEIKGLKRKHNWNIGIIILLLVVIISLVILKFLRIL